MCVIYIVSNNTFFFEPGRSTLTTKRGWHQVQAQLNLRSQSPMVLCLMAPQPHFQNQMLVKYRNLWTQLCQNLPRKQQSRLSKQVWRPWSSHLQWNRLRRLWTIRSSHQLLWNRLRRKQEKEQTQRLQDLQIEPWNLQACRPWWRTMRPGCKFKTRMPWPKRSSRQRALPRARRPLRSTGPPIKRREWGWSVWWRSHRRGRSFHTCRSFGAAPRQWLGLFWRPFFIP